jgi:hypothetical protein
MLLRKLTEREPRMTDLIFIALLVAFFALSAGLIRFCASLMRRGGSS